jgi:diphthamide synthase (EF-2-diphthine--ammonia ligase)
MRAIFPIWKRDTRELIDTFLARGFRSITCCIDTRKLDDSFVGREIDRRFLDELPAGVDPCGENGEFHSYTCAGPLFDREIPVRRGEIVRKDSFLFCDLLPN